MAKIEPVTVKVETLIPHTAIDSWAKLALLGGMSREEVVSRANAWDEVKQAIAEALGSIQFKADGVSEEEATALRALIDAQKHGQAHPLVRTVVVRDEGKDSD